MSEPIASVLVTNGENGRSMTILGQQGSLLLAGEGSISGYALDQLFAAHEAGELRDIQGAKVLMAAVKTEHHEVTEIAHAYWRDGQYVLKIVDKKLMLNDQVIDDQLAYQIKSLTEDFITMGAIWVPLALCATHISAGLRSEDESKRQMAQALAPMLNAGYFIPGDMGEIPLQRIGAGIIAVVQPSFADHDPATDARMVRFDMLQLVPGRDGEILFAWA